MKPCLTYQNGPSQGVQKDFGPGAPVEIEEGPCKLTCTFANGVAFLDVEAGRVLLGQVGKPGGQQVKGKVELRPGDLLLVGELQLAYKLVPGDPPAPKAPPVAAAPAPGVVVSRKPRVEAAAGPAVVIASPRKAAPPAADAPKPARFLFRFLAPEKQKNAYYQLLLVIFLLLFAFSGGLVVGSQSKIKEPPNAELEPSIRYMLYERAKALGWDYPKLLQELRQAEANKARPLALWWLTLPKAPKKGQRP